MWPRNFSRRSTTNRESFSSLYCLLLTLHEENDNLIVTVDIPGFDKSDIKVSMNGNVLSINAEKKDSKNGRTIMKQRPRVIDKKMRLPITVKEGEERGKLCKIC